MAFSIPVHSEIPIIYQVHAKRANVPADIWFALLKQESCIPLASSSDCLPWPWTLNVAGKPYRFKTLKAATAFAETADRQGLSVDVGLGQLHLQSHRSQFSSIQHMISINANLAYSAQYLRKQYIESGDWWTAVGRYHSPSNQKRAKQYQTHVYTRWESSS